MSCKYIYTFIDTRGLFDVPVIWISCLSKKPSMRGMVESVPLVCVLKSHFPGSAGHEQDWQPSYPVGAETAKVNEKQLKRSNRRRRFMVGDCGDPGMRHFGGGMRVRHSRLDGGPKKKRSTGG